MRNGFRAAIDRVNLRTDDSWQSIPKLSECIKIASTMELMVVEK